MKLLESLTEDEMWLVYDLLTARSESLYDLEIRAEQGMGAKKYADAALKVRAYLAPSCRYCGRMPHDKECPETITEEESVRRVFAKHGAA